MPHHRLLGKLRHCGINGRALEWITDFLSGRTQRITVDGTYSRWSPVHSGVPQGTVLGPLLFLIYINNLPDSVSSTVRLFADDCLVYREVGSIDDQLALQRDLDFLENWAHIWGMKFNPSKCTILTISRSLPLHKFYSLCGAILQQVSEAKYLGVIISEDLHWSKHIQGLAPKTSSTLGLLRRNLSLCPQKLREQAYISLNQVSTGVLCSNLGSASTPPSKSLASLWLAGQLVVIPLLRWPYFQKYHTEYFKFRMINARYMITTGP